MHENPRASLLLANGMVYLSWASSCDIPPYYGWVMAYRADTLQQVALWNAAPLTGYSGIWQSDTGPAADEEGNVYAVTGNGVFDAASGGRDYGDSIVKLALIGGELEVKDYFTPHDQEELNRTDGDLGSGGVILLPQQTGSHAHLLVTGGKGGVVYVLNRNHLGRFHQGDDSNALSTVKVEGHIFGAPAYWNGHVYLQPENDVLTDFSVRNDQLVPAAQSNARLAQPGATPAISANGTKDAIVWIVSTTETGFTERPTVLLAFDGTNVANELYSSDEDSPSVSVSAGRAIRFVIPLVAKGRVYVGTAGQVDVYGLLPTAQPEKAERGGRLNRNK